MKKIISTFLIIVLFLSLFACSKEEEVVVSYSTTKAFDETLYLIDGISVPEALGYPELKDEELIEMSLDDLKDKGLNYIDLIRYIKLNNETSDPRLITKKYAEVLAKYYDEAGIIAVETNKVNYNYVYVKKDGLYYPLDLYDQSQNDMGWFTGYGGSKYVYDNIDDVVNNLKEQFRYMDSDDSVQEVTYKKVDPLNKYVIESDDGRTFNAQNRLDIDVYYLNDIQIPVGLGFPEYSNEEIDQMIANPDKSGVADKIHTIGDAINYVIRAGFTFDEYHNVDYGDYFLIDVGNRYYYTNGNMERMSYSLSGLEILTLETAQCSAMCTLFNYLLWGDYPEVGYCNIPRHAFMYIKGNDNKYYVVDPVKYTLDEEQYQTWFNEENFTKLTSDTVEGLMANIMEAKWLDTYYVIYWTYDGTFTFWSGNFEVPEEFLSNPVIFPEGSDGHIYGQDLEIIYTTPEHDTSHEYILGVNFE